MGVNCRLTACSRLRDSRARGIEIARTRKKWRKLGRGGAVRAFHYPHTLAPFPLSESLEQAIRNTTHQT